MSGPIAVLAGTPVDTQMGVDVLGSRGLTGAAFPLAEDPRLEYNYPAFGRVVEGLEEILRWNHLPVRDVPTHLGPGVRVAAPVEPIVFTRVEVETFGVDYPPPERLEGAVLPPNWA